MTPPPGPPETAPQPATHSFSVRLPTQPVRVTYVFLALIGLVFAAQFGFEALLGYDPILVLGAKVNELIAEGQVWRLLTAVFIHASVLHIAFNAYALYNLGAQVETFYGPLRFSLLYLLAGLSGSVASLIFSPAPSVGASGAIFGLIGAMAVLLYRNRRVFGERGRRSLQSIIVIALINLAIGLQGGIDNWAHFGGLVGGLLLGWAIGPVWALPEQPALALGPITLEDQQPLTLPRWLGVSAFAVALAALTGLGVSLQR
ncbi:MAG: rhomboid family intramembrane serine protease [Anaerolineales bacterium]